MKAHAGYGNQTAMVNHKRFWLVAPAWLWLAADVGLTLAGQSEAYWSGDYTAALEGNPLAQPIVAQGPWVFASVAAAWAALLGLLVYRISNRIVSWFVMILAASHAVGGATWLVSICSSPPRCRSGAGDDRPN